MTTSTFVMYVILGALGIVVVFSAIKKIAKAIFRFMVNSHLLYIVADMVDAHTDSYKAIPESIVPTLDLIGLFRPGMRWSTYKYAYDLRYYYVTVQYKTVKNLVTATINKVRIKMYLNAIRKYIIANNIRICGEDINERGYIKFVFSDNTTYTIYLDFAWCDLMAAIWSERDGRNYSSFTFYSSDCVDSLSPTLPAKIKNSVLSVISL